MPSRRGWPKACSRACGHAGVRDKSGDACRRASFTDADLPAPDRSAGERQGYPQAPGEPFVLSLAPFVLSLAPIRELTSNGRRRVRAFTRAYASEFVLSLARKQPNT